MDATSVQWIGRFLVIPSHSIILLVSFAMQLHLSLSAFRNCGTWPYERGRDTITLPCWFGDLHLRNMDSLGGGETAEVIDS